MRWHRKERGISGTELAQITGVTQGTISKFEHGQLVPDLDYLARFAHTLRLQEQEASRLLKMAGAVPDGATDRRVLQYLPVDFLQVDWAHRRQETVAHAEANSTIIHVFNPLIVPGLLQTEQYARYVITAAGVDGERAERAVTSRIKRQDTLKRSNRRVMFVLTQAALLTRVAPDSVLREQIEHLQKLVSDDCIEVGLIPTDIPLPVIPPPAFYLFDQRVYIELPHGDLWLLSRSQAYETYQKLFKSLAKTALRGDAVVQKCSEIALSLAVKRVD